MYTGTSGEMMDGERVLRVPVVSRKSPGNVEPVASAALQRLLPPISRNRTVWELGIKYLQITPEHANQHYVAWLER